MTNMNVLDLKKLSELLREGISQLSWHKRVRQASVIRGILKDENCNICIGKRDGFGWLTCNGLPQASPYTSLKISSSLCGPARLTKRAASSTIPLAASWPQRLPIESQTRILITDLKRLRKSSMADAWSPIPVNSHVKRRLRDVIVARDGIVEVPTGGRTWVFAIKRDSNANQYCAYQPNEHVLSVNLLVTNWTARGHTSCSAASTLVLLLNRRLRWVRLMLRGTAIEAQVAIPVDAITEYVWTQARHALGQAVTSCREPLRIIQLPEVARVFEKNYGS